MVATIAFGMGIDKTECAVNLSPILTCPRTSRPFTRRQVLVPGETGSPPTPGWLWHGGCMILWRLSMGPTSRNASAASNDRNSMRFWGFAKPPLAGARSCSGISAKAGIRPAAIATIACIRRRSGWREDGAKGIIGGALYRRAFRRWASCRYLMRRVDGTRAPVGTSSIEDLRRRQRARQETLAIRFPSACGARAFASRCGGHGGLKFGETGAGRAARQSAGGFPQRTQKGAPPRRSPQRCWAGPITFFHQRAALPSLARTALVTCTRKKRAVLRHFSTIRPCWNWSPQADRFGRHGRHPALAATSSIATP